MSTHYYWQIFPKELKEEEFVYLSLLYPDGNTRDLVVGNGFKDGKKATKIDDLRQKKP